MKKMICFITIVVSLALVFWGTSNAVAYPEKNIVFIVPYAPGGGFDVIARITAPFIEKHLPKKTNVVVKNVTGAGTRIGTMEILRSKPDGYTIGICEVTNLGFGLLGLSDELKGVKPEDVSWLCRLDDLPMGVLIAAKSGFKSPADMKDKGIRLGVVDTSNHFKTALVAKALGMKPTFIRYDGASQVNIALIQGDTDVYLSNWASAKRMVDASEGKILPLFMASVKRIPDWKEVPTARELGVVLEESMIEYNHYLFAQPNLPSGIRKVWEETMNKLLKDSEWIAQMKKAGFPPVGATGEKLNGEVIAVYKATEKYKDLVTSLGIK